MAAFRPNIRTTTKGSIGIKYTLRGWEEFKNGLESGLVRMSDNRKLHSRIGINILKWIDRNFREEGIEKRWPPLSPTTIKLRRQGPLKIQREQRGGDIRNTVTSRFKILQDTGNLRRSFTSVPSNNKVIVGSNDIKASTHELGRQQKWGQGKLVTIPQRKMLPTNKVVTPIVRKTYDKFIKESFKKVL